MPGNAVETPASDEELACRAQGGCQASFEQLLRRYQIPVLHFLRQRGLGADTEDLLQEVFLRAYENLHRYRPRWPFSAWLFTIARRMSINHHRRVRPDAGGSGGAVEALAAAGPLPLETSLRPRSAAGYGIWLPSTSPKSNARRCGCTTSRKCRCGRLPWCSTVR